MADMGFMPEVTAILDQMPAGGQRLLFSATLDNGIDQLVARYLTDPVTHSTDDGQGLGHHDGAPRLLIDPMHKKTITAEVANREGRTVVFVRTKLGADRVALQLREQGVFAAALHGGLNQGARNRVLGAFRDGVAAGAGRHGRRRPRHPRRRRLRRPAGRPAGRPQGLPAPLGPHGTRRRQGHGRDPGAAAPAQGHGADGPRGRHRRRCRPRPSPATSALRRPARRAPAASRSPRTRSAGSSRARSAAAVPVAPRAAERARVATAARAVAPASGPSAPAASAVSAATAAATAAHAPDPAAYLRPAALVPSRTRAAGLCHGAAVPWAE